jgi:hypothetical protein
MSDDDNFDWEAPDLDLVIPPQGETAVYKNPKEATVIRQRDPFGGDEQFVVILPQYLAGLIEVLQRHQAEYEERKRA